MYGQAAKKLLFMGDEIGQRAEWSHESSVGWHLLEHESHLGLQKWVRDLNHLYRAEPALHELDCEPDGFQWVDCNDAEQSTISFLRRGRSRDDVILVVCNFTPIPRHNYRVGVPRGGHWREVLNSDSGEYWGQGFGNFGGVEAVPFGAHGQPCSLNITLPPLGVVFFKSEGDSSGEHRLEGQEPILPFEGTPSPPPPPAPEKKKPRPQRKKAASQKAPAAKRATKKAPRKRPSPRKTARGRSKGTPGGDPA
jgi:1,4-alpha-glucan branching enzyme